MSRRRSRGRDSRKTKINKNYIITILIILIICFSLTLYIVNINQKKKIAEEKDRISHHQQEIFKSTNEELEELEKLDNYKTNTLIRISAVGDILFGNKLEENGQPYDNIFKDVKKYLKDSDFSVGTYETYANESNTEFVSSLKNAGISYASLAHNHSLDLGKEGLEETNKILNENGIETIGLYDESSEKRIKFFEKNEVKIALLAYTYDNGKEGVNVFEEEMVKEDLKYAEENANFSIVLMHWGDVNNNKTSKTQEEQAHFLVENGADAILGAHPSVVQKMEVVKNNENKDSFIAYSLGDFTSEFENENANLELILNMQIFVDKDGNAQIYKIDYVPVYMNDNGKNLKENRFKILDMKAEIAKYDSEQESVTKDVYDKLIRAVDRLNSIIIK